MIFSPILAVTGLLMFIFFMLMASIVIIKRFPRLRGETATKLLGGWRWLLWATSCLVLAACGAWLMGSQMSPDTLYQANAKTIAQDRQGNAYIVFDDGATRPCAVAAECLALPDNTWITYQWVWRGDNALIRVVGKA